MENEFQILEEERRFTIFSLILILHCLISYKSYFIVYRNS